tara:strand:- start:7260 stop:10325 length:3066 start_codon:yes stop_codon:yes gene_type:complete
MKLLTLEMSAFGPFAGKECINFADLGENPLFLIDGQTGAGKSSILHAICYALYGETTDTERKEQGLRSDHAAPDLLTELELTFSIRGQQYRITRIPTQMRPAKRGGGETEHKATAHLVKILSDGTDETLVPKKKTEADAYIKEIVGLSADQFRQVMVLPQGKFRELLLAKSDDRQEILSTLFQTEIYKRIEYILKDKAGDIERQNKEFEKSKTEALIDAHVADEEGLTESLEEAHAQLQIQAEHKDKSDKARQTVAAAIKSAEELIKSFDARDEKHQSLHALQTEQDAINAKRNSIAKAEKSAKIAPIWQALQTVNDDITQKNQSISNALEAEVAASTKLEDASQALKQAAKAYQQRDTLKARETQLIGYRKILDNYETLKEATAKAASEHQRIKNKKSELSEQLNTIAAKIEEHKGSIHALSERISQKAIIVAQEIQAKSNLETRQQLDTAQSKLKTTQKAEVQAQSVFEQASHDYQLAEQDADRLDLLWLNSQAAVLAAKLDDGIPCQVCGSTEHPSLASFDAESENINQDIVDQARAKQSQQLKARSDADKLRSKQHSALEQQLETINTLEQSLGDNAKQTVVELQRIHHGFCEQLKQIERDEKALHSIANESQQLEAKQAPLLTELDALATLLTNLITNEATANTNLQNAEKELPKEYRSLEALEQAIMTTQQTINQLEKAREDAEETEKKRRSEHDTAKATHESLEKALAALKVRHTEQKGKWKTALESSEFTIQADFENANIEPQTLDMLKQEVATYDKLLRELSAQLELMDSQLKDKQLPELTALQKQYDEAEVTFKAAENVWTKAQTHKTLLSKTNEKINKINADQQKIRQQYEVVGKLHKAASGKGEVRVSLERFVLGNLLDAVLGIASQRLHIMNKGQYRLVRQDETHQRRNAPTGLDLAIDDAHSGKTRPVATLSGGESFMASLSLALALSDVVQQRSGGIQMDTLFVDEGFGSLDPESLQLAIDTLVDLQSSGRTIGIISHVSELKEQMAQRIDVVSTRNGSTVKTVAA